MIRVSHIPHVGHLFLWCQALTYSLWKETSI